MSSTDGSEIDKLTSVGHLARFFLALGKSWPMREDGQVDK